VTHEIGSGKAQSAAMPSGIASICNAAAAYFMRSPFGPKAGWPQGVVAHSLCAEGTPPHSRLALRPACLGREPSDSVNRP
jgi:hypothetical protein